MKTRLIIQIVAMVLLLGSARVAGAAEPQTPVPAVTYATPAPAEPACPDCIAWQRVGAPETVVG